LTPRSGLGAPAYSRIADELRSLAQSSDGDVRLPTEAELSADYRVSRQTVRRAYQELVADGLVERTPGRGTFATGVKYARSFGTIDELMGLSEDTELEIVRPLELAAGTPRARADLDAPHVMELWALRLNAGEPFALTVISFPIAIGRQLKKTIFARAGARTRMTALQLVETRIGISICSATQEISVERIESQIAVLLEMDAGGYVLRVDRVYCDALGLPVESTLNYFNPARYTYRLHLGRSARHRSG
jgi:GntR family transcriptional regulator